VLWLSVGEGDENGGARLEVNEEEAEIVRRIFSLYAEPGCSLKKIAHTLNAEGVTAPQPRKGRMQSWCLQCPPRSSESPVCWEDRVEHPAQGSRTRHKQTCLQAAT
jgi:hypothetical protein